MQEKKSLTAKINREIRRLAFPNIISNISVPLISSVDTALMGRLSPLHLGAIGLGAMLFNFLYWNFGFLRMGTTGMVAQAYGRQNTREMAAHLAQALVVAIAIGLLLIIFSAPIYSLAELALNISPEHNPLVWEYFNYKIFAAPASLLLFAFLGFFFGMQNAVYPLIITIVINVLNIGLDFLLVRSFGLGIAGIGIAGLIAQYSGVLLAAGLLLRKYRHVIQEFRKEMIQRFSGYARFFRINRDIFIRTLFLSGAFLFFYAQSSRFGASVLALNVVLLQFLNWMSYVVDGYAYASESLVGKYTGRKDEKSVLKTIRLSFVWGIGVAVFFSLLYGFAGTPLLSLFTDDATVREASLAFLPWMIVLPIAGFACYIWDGVYIGLTASRAMRNTSIIAFVGYILTWYFTRDVLGAHSLWFSLLIYLFLRGVLQTIWFARYRLALR